MNESNQTIESLLAQLPEERLPNEWLFSIQMGYILLAVCLVILCIAGIFIFRKLKKHKIKQFIFKNWIVIFENDQLSDHKKIEQANTVIKLHLKRNKHSINIQTLNTDQWFDFLRKNFPDIQKSTIELLAHSHYQLKCEIPNPEEFNLNIQAILMECLK
ncbi:DUF4381 family protein [Marinicellulosiphila megalodicopiae]|uniref:DUF4381 family protein n=1 Tax=Marinicellulosiphila megalodicopiae TaxID=2724896 RepID=UPI003BB08F86